MNLHSSGINLWPLELFPHHWHIAYPEFITVPGDCPLTQRPAEAVINIHAEVTEIELVSCCGVTNGNLDKPPPLCFDIQHHTPLTCGGPKNQPCTSAPVVYTHIHLLAFNQEKDTWCNMQISAQKYQGWHTKHITSAAYTIHYCEKCLAGEPDN